MSNKPTHNRQLATSTAKEFVIVSVGFILLTITCLVGALYIKQTIYKKKLCSESKKAIEFLNCGDVLSAKNVITNAKPLFGRLHQMQTYTNFFVYCGLIEKVMRAQEAKDLTISRIGISELRNLGWVQGAAIDYLENNNKKLVERHTNEMLTNFRAFLSAANWERAEFVISNLMVIGENNVNIDGLKSEYKIAKIKTYSMLVTEYANKMKWDEVSQYSRKILEIDSKNAFALYKLRAANSVGNNASKSLVLSDSDKPAHETSHGDRNFVKNSNSLKDKDLVLLKNRTLTEQQAIVTIALVENYGFTVRDFLEAWDEGVRRHLFKGTADMSDSVQVKNFLRILSSARDLYR